MSDIDFNAVRRSPKGTGNTGRSMANEPYTQFDRFLAYRQLGSRDVLGKRGLVGENNPGPDAGHTNLPVNPNKPR